MMRVSMRTDESSSSEDEKADQGCLRVEVKIKCSGKKKKALGSSKKGSGKDLQQEIATVKDSPIEQVRLVVPTTDDPTIPSFTFRVLILGLFFCVILSVVDNLFSVRQNPIGISSVVVTLLSLPMGRFMAANLPERVMRIPLIGYEFTFNPGPFSLKEHVLTVVLATTGVGNMTSNIIAILKTTFDIMLDPIPMLLLSLTIVFLGYGIAGLFTSLLVDSPYMWWPYNLVTVTFYRALHEKEKRPKGGLTRLQFFVVVSALSCAYYVVPNFFFPSITALSFVCWIYKDSVLAQLLGSGLHGFGFGAIAFDWSTVTAYLGSPLCLPTHVIINSFAGFLILFYVVCPIAYWKNAFLSQSFPYFSSDIYDKFGQPYNLTRILKTNSLELDVNAYKDYSNLYSGIVFALSYGFIFASITAGLSQVLLFNGKELWDQVTMMFSDADKGDIHNVLMDKYEKIPKWWYFVILVPTLAISFYTIEGFGGQLQLRYWGLLLALLLVLIFIIPIGFIQATTGQGIGLDTLAQILIGYIDPGKPISNKVFESYVTSTMGSILATLSDLKLAHYLKIPPKDMMLAQIIGSFFGATLTFLVTWWMFTSIENICHPELLPPGSPWTCPYITMMSSITAMYGLVGPSYVFFPHGVYSSMFIFFIIGALAPIPLWLLARAYPEKEWIQKINLPIIFTAGAYIPPATAMHYWIWFFVGIFFSHYVYKYHKRWWAKNVFILSIGLDTGVAVMALVASVTVNVANIYGISWWGLELDDHCPLAKCPIATGVEVGGCPKY